MTTAPTSSAIAKTVNAVGIGSSAWLERPALIVNKYKPFVRVKINENSCCIRQPIAVVYLQLRASNPRQKSKMNATKEQALTNLTEAGYAAEITKTGLDVRGDGWSAHYDDRGQDHNEYIGQVPAKVEELAVWDDASTREETL